MEHQRRPRSEQSKPPAKLTGTAVRLSGLVEWPTPPSNGRASCSFSNVAMYLHDTDGLV